MPTIYSKEALGKDRVDGFYDTPIQTVEYICSKILNNYKVGMKILDPAVGDGVFLKYLESKGIAKEDLYGFDIDKDKISFLKSDFPNVCLFDSTNPLEEKYDFIVGNPPYNDDESHYMRENRERLEKVSIEIGAKNTFSIISYQSIKSLKTGGIFSMILSDAFLTNTYYKPFRDFLLREVQIEELLLAPWKLFQKRSADVRTGILTCVKKDSFELVGNSNHTKNTIRLVDRLAGEDEYYNPPSVEYVEQSDLVKYPNHTFLIGVPDEIRKLYLEPPSRLGDHVMGGTGISTGNDKKFLKRSSEVTGNNDWVPYYKNGARKPYWYDPAFSIERNYGPNNKSTKNFMIRNESFFFQEGITCSSVGVRFSAAYLPPDCLFGVNANFFFKDRVSLFYTLGLLNSRVAWYFARRVLIRTNNISANYLRLLPYIEPADDLKKEIAEKVKSIVFEIKNDSSYDFEMIQSDLDKSFFNIYGFGQSIQNIINDFCINFYDRL